MAPELEQVRQDVAAITHGWSDAHWSRALPGKWTNGQILEHLLLTYTGTSKGIRRALEAGTMPQRKITLPHKVRKFVVIRLNFMPSGREAFRQILPSAGLNSQSMRHFYDALVAMDATLNDAERRFGKMSRLLEHPFLGPLTAQEWRCFHRTHTRHHLKQIKERIRTVSAVSQVQLSA